MRPSVLPGRSRFSTATLCAERLPFGHAFDPNLRRRAAVMVTSSGGARVSSHGMAVVPPVMYGAIGVMGDHVLAHQDSWAYNQEHSRVVNRRPLQMVASGVSRMVQDIPHIYCS